MTVSPPIRITWRIGQMRTSQKPGAASQHKSGTNPSHEKPDRIFSGLARACADGRSVSQASPVVEVLGERRLWFSGLPRQGQPAKLVKMNAAIGLNFIFDVLCVHKPVRRRDRTGTSSIRSFLPARKRCRAVAFGRAGRPGSSRRIRPGFCRVEMVSGRACHRNISFFARQVKLDRQEQSARI